MKPDTMVVRTVPRWMGEIETMQTRIEHVRDRPPRCAGCRVRLDRWYAHKHVRCVSCRMNSGEETGAW